MGSGSKKVDIHTIPDLALRVVLHTITRAAGSQAPHEATKATPVSLRMRESLIVRLGHNSNNKHEETAHKMQAS